MTRRLGVGYDSDFREVYCLVRVLFIVPQLHVVVNVFLAHLRVGTACHRRLNLDKLHSPSIVLQFMVVVNAFLAHMRVMPRALGDLAL